MSALLPPQTEPYAAVAARRGRRDRLSVAGIAILGAYVLIAILAPWIAPHDPLQQDLLNRLAPPSAEHWLGTDDLGQDVFSRLLWATRVDLPVGFAAAAISAIIGSTIGALGGFVGRWLDMLLMRLGDLVMAFPSYVFVIALVALMGNGVPSILVAFAIVGWVGYARVIRVEVRRVKLEQYTESARLAGVARLRILWRHVLPNAVRPSLSMFVLDVMGSIIVLASLSYLGVGVVPPTPEWGAMVANGQRYLQTNWWLIAAPGAAIAVLGLGLLLLGESVERKLKG